MNDKLEIGIQLFRSLAGKDGFLRREFTWACLKCEVNTPKLEQAEKRKPFYGESYLYSSRVDEDYVPVKVRFSFSHESIAEMALFRISRTVKLRASFPPYTF